MRILVGLGNPGPKYKSTRHNVGFAALDFFHEKHFADAGFPPFAENKKFRALTSEGFFNNEKIVLLKPLTYMNESGLAVAAAANFYKIAAADIIIIHDELDLPFAEFKIQRDRGAAGHNGVSDIFDKLGSQNCARLRLGIGPRPAGPQAADFVLTKFSLLERLRLNKIFAAAWGSLSAELKNQ